MDRRRLADQALRATISTVPYTCAESSGSESAAYDGRGSDVGHDIQDYIQQNRAPKVLGAAVLGDGGIVVLVLLRRAETGPKHGCNTRQWGIPGIHISLLNHTGSNFCPSWNCGSHVMLTDAVTRSGFRTAPPTLPV